jgi:hypothetical protein
LPHARDGEPFAVAASGTNLEVGSVRRCERIGARAGMTWFDRADR